MDTFLSQIEWVPVLVSFVLAFGLGWFWFSDKMFGERWHRGVGTAIWQPPLWMPMSAQAGSTFLLAIIVNMATLDGHVFHAILVGLTVAGMIKANGLFAGKSLYAISVETGYMIAMVVIMVATNMLM